MSKFFPSFPLKDIYFCLFFKHFVSNMINAISLRMNAIALHSKTVEETFAMTLKLQHARYSQVFKAAG